jgi:hypothetical protein
MDKNLDLILMILLLWVDIAAETPAGKSLAVSSPQNWCLNLVNKSFD